MDLPSITTVVEPVDRAAIPDSGLFVGGGTAVFSEPHLGHHTLIDLTALRWPAITVRSDGIDVAGTATLEQLATLRDPAQWPTTDWPATALFDQGARCLLASFKVLGAATIGGNLAVAFPAGAMIAVSVALNASVLVWRADGSDLTVPAADFVVWSNHTVLQPGDLIRSLHFPASALQCRTALRKAAMADKGRSGVLLIGRTQPDGSASLTVTAATHRPVVLGTGTDWEAAGRGIDPELFVDDVHGAADWRRSVVSVLAAEIATELGWS